MKVVGYPSCIKYINGSEISVYAGEKLCEMTEGRKSKKNGLI